ncbi:hypothetical protein QEN19_000287 [Hanseniaspora menglaensis]
MNGEMNNHDHSKSEEPLMVSLPLLYQKCPLEHFLRLISRMLSSLIYMNDYKLRAQEMIHQQQLLNAQNIVTRTSSPDYTEHMSKTNKNVSTSNLKNIVNYSQTPAVPTPSSVSTESHLSIPVSTSMTPSNRSLSSAGIVLTRFHSKTPPEISVLDYLYRLTKFSSLDHTVLLAMMSYIDLLMLACPSFEISSLTVHRFLLAATTVACKGLRDSFYTNEHYAKVGGVHVSELNVLEQELLTQINYRILPRNSTTDLLKSELEKKKFVVFPNELLGGFPDHGSSSYDSLAKIYQSMVELVGNWETVIYVSDRLPVYFGPKEQQNLFKYQKSMWAKDVNFIENSKHHISYFLINDVSIKKEKEYLDKNSKDLKAVIEKQSIENPSCNIKNTPVSTNLTIRHSEKSGSQKVAIPTELLANYFNPEIFKQTQIHKKVEKNRTSDMGVSELNITEKNGEDMNGGIYKKKKLSVLSVSKRSHER